MRKRWGNFLQKAMAVLLSAVLCVGLAVGAEPMEVRAADVTYWFRLTVLGEETTNVVKSVTFTTNTGSFVATPTQNVEYGVITYEVSKPQGGYTWQVRLGKDGKDGGNFQASPGIAPLVTFCTTWFKDGDTVIDTRYVMQGMNMNSIPAPPSKKGYNFAGWVTEDGQAFNSSYILTTPISIYCAWTKDTVQITDDIFRKKVQDIVGAMSVSNDTTEEWVRNYVKGQLDAFFEIDSTVNLSEYKLTEATSVSKGQLCFDINASYGMYSADMVADIEIPLIHIEVLGKDWTLGADGILNITSQEGMNDWLSDGRSKCDLMVVKNVLIDEGVTDIPSMAFAGCLSLTEVTLPPSLQSLGSDAFSGCGSLEKVVMQGETPPPFISESAFDGCKFIKEPENTEGIVVPHGSGDAYKEIAGGAFRDYIKEQTPELTQETLDNKLEEILKNLTVSNATYEEEIKAKVKEAIDDYFQTDAVIKILSFNLTEATIENEGALEVKVSVESNGISAIRSEIITIPKLIVPPDRGWTLDEAGNLTITSPEGMNDWAQNGRLEEDNTLDVKNVIIADGVTEIPDNAFNGCSNLGSVTLPDSVTSIGNSSFAGSSSLGEITLPPDLGSIGSGAFSGCSSLEKVVMRGETPPSVGDSAFDGCKFVEEPENTEGIVVPPGSGDAYKESGGGVFGDYIKEQAPELTQEALDNKLEEILDNLPVSNDITIVEVTNEVKKAIDEYFQMDSTIEPGRLDITDATIMKEGLVIWDVTVSCGGLSAKKEMRRTIPKLPAEQDRGWSLDEAGNLIITSPEGMRDWAENGRTEADNSSKINHVVIENGVTEIPDNAFSGCDNLETITIPNSVAVIGDSAFAGNESLKEVILPSGLQAIGNGAFSGCGALDRVVMQGTEPPAMGDSVFDQCKFVEDNTEGIIVPEGSEDKYKAEWGDSLGGYITEKLPAVTEEALGKKLQEVFDGLVVSNETTPEGIKEEIKKAIDGYFQITSQVAIAGFDLTAATSDSEGTLKLAVTVKNGDACSAKAEGTISIPKLPLPPDRGWELDEAGNLTIKDQAGMDDWAQAGKGETGASSIRNVAIMGDVTAIPDSAFSSCNNLTAVTIPETVTTIGDLAFAFNPSLPAVTIPKGVQSIGKEAFLGCDSLEKVVMQGSIPPAIGEAAFDHCKFTDKENATGGIVVPQDSESAYKDAWGDYSEFIAGKHTHKYADEWKFDGIYHWHECISCKAQGHKAAHEWGEGNVIKEPTALEGGIIDYACPVCGAVRREQIPATGTPSTSGNENQGGNNPSTSGNGNQGGNTPSTSGNGNQGGDIPSTSGNGNPGGDTPSTPGGGNPGGNTPSTPGEGNPGGDTPSTPGGGNPGGNTPSTPGEGNPGGNTPSTPGGGNPGGNTPSTPGGGNPGGDTPSTPGSGNPGEGSGTLDQDMYQPTGNNTGSVPLTPEPKTGDGISTRLYATTAMILGFTYLLLMFSEKHGMTEETKKELLSRMIGWAKYGGRLRRMLALAGIFLLLAYYHSIGKEVTAEEKTGLPIERTI